jgi:hypothetical protein
VGTLRKAGLVGSRGNSVALEIFNYQKIGKLRGQGGENPIGSNSVTVPGKKHPDGNGILQAGMLLL